MSNDLYVQIDQEKINVGDFAVYRYTGRNLGVVTEKRYSKIWRNSFVKCTDYPYEINIYDVIPFRCVSKTDDQNP